MKSKRKSPNPYEGKAFFSGPTEYKKHLKRIPKPSKKRHKSSNSHSAQKLRTNETGMLHQKMRSHSTLGNKPMPVVNIIEEQDAYQTHSSEALLHSASDARD